MIREIPHKILEIANTNSVCTLIKKYVQSVRRVLPVPVKRNLFDARDQLMCKSIACFCFIFFYRFSFQRGFVIL